MQHVSHMSISPGGGGENCNAVCKKREKESSPRKQPRISYLLFSRNLVAATSVKKKLQRGLSPFFASSSPAAAGLTAAPAAAAAAKGRGTRQEEFTD